MITLWKGYVLVVSVCLFFLTSYANACTDFRLMAKDGTALVARSLEFSLDFKSNLRSMPREQAFVTKAPDGTPGLSWKSKYGYVFMDGLNVDAVVDGMNEEGLSFEALLMPFYATYQTVPAGQNANALPYLDFGAWILGNFKTVDEVKQALGKVIVFEQKNPQLGDMIFPLHYSIFDVSGKGIVIEYVGGHRYIYDNTVSVMTNSPTFSWHLTNVVNYLHLTPANPNPVVLEGVQYGATGQGYGMIGLPGDISPPSRFIKTLALTKVALPADDAAQVLNLAEHIINNVDIPRGLAREPSKNNQATNDMTQWVVFKDLKNKVLYYRTYNDLALRKLALSKVDFSPGAKRMKMPIYSPVSIKDITEQFLASPQVVVSQ